MSEYTLAYSIQTEGAEPFVANNAMLAGRASAKTMRQVVLFADTFSRHYEPDALHAACSVLEQGGCAVRWANPVRKGSRPLCCGRTYLAQGMVKEAQAEAVRTLEVLLRHVRDGRTIIGLEPACILTMRDDWKALGLGDAVAKLVPHVVLFEEFLAHEQLPMPLSYERPKEALLVHGHCHQKAAGAMKSMRKVLKSVPGLDFDFLDAACCGMAGSFGVEAEHFGLSQAMAEQAPTHSLHQGPICANVGRNPHSLAVTTPPQ